MARFNNIPDLLLLSRHQKDGVQYDFYIQDQSPAMAALVIMDTDSREIVSITTADESTMIQRRDLLLMNARAEQVCMDDVAQSFGCNCRQCLTNKLETLRIERKNQCK